MLPNIDNRLDMSFCLSTPLNSYVLSSIAKENPVPISVHLHGDRMYFNFFISRLSVKDRMLIETLNPVTIGEITVITEEIENIILRTIYESVNSFPTIANGELYTKNGDLFTSYRFHSSDMTNVSRLLRKIVSLDTNVHNLRMGHSKGLTKVLDDIDSRIPLTTVTFSCEGASEKEFVIEWKNIEGDPFGALFYDIKNKKSIKTFDMSKYPSRPLIAAVLKDHIPLASHLEYHDTKRVKCITTVPTWLLKPFLVRLYESIGEIDNLKVESIEQYREARGIMDECGGQDITDFPFRE